MSPKTAQARAVLTRLSRHLDTSNNLDMSPDELLEQERGIRRYWDLVHCIANVDRFAIHYFPLSTAIEVNRLRCALKYNCPRCMSPANVLHRRDKDFQILVGAQQWLADNNTGHGTRIWHFQYTSHLEPSIKTISKALRRSDNRHKPILTGDDWAGEAICAPRRAIRPNLYGLSGGTMFILNALVIGEKGSDLDVERLSKLLPQCKIQEFSSLFLAWERYLTCWAYEQIEERTPEEVEQWMTDGKRGFQALGKFRGLRAKVDRNRKERLHDQKGPSISLGLCNTSQKADEVLAYCAQVMAERYQAKMGEDMSKWEQDKALLQLARQLTDALKAEETMKIQQQIKKLEQELKIAQQLSTEQILAKIDEVRGRDVMDEERAERKPRRPMKQ